MTHWPPAERPERGDDDPFALAREAAAQVSHRTGADRHDVAVVLGSGWQPAAEELGAIHHELPFTDLIGFAPPAPVGHPGVLRSITLQSGHRVLAFLGRTHLYEGRGVDAVVHATRTAAAAGCSAIVLTNAAGGLVPSWAPGTPVLVRDHLNLTGATPLRGATFLDLTDLYAPRLRQMCRALDPTLPEGVYAQFRGPQYETPAEVRMAGILGADLVGMSTVVEAIAAREAGLEVLAVSLVTNLAAGLSPGPLDHREVLRVGDQSARRMGALLARVLPQIAAAG